MFSLLNRCLFEVREGPPACLRSLELPVLRGIVALLSIGVLDRHMRRRFQVLRLFVTSRLGTLEGLLVSGVG